MLEKACAANDLNACFSLEAAYEAGEDNPADPAKARKYKARFKELAEKAHEKNDTQTVTQDAETEKRLAEEAEKNAPKVAGWETDCTAGKVTACQQLGRQFELGDSEKALDVRDPRAAAGGWNETGHPDLGRAGRPQGSRGVRTEIYRRACEVSDASSCGVGGLMLLKKQNQPGPGMKMTSRRPARSGGRTAGGKVVAGEYRGTPGVPKNAARAEEFERRSKNRWPPHKSRGEEGRVDREEQERKLPPAHHGAGAAAGRGAPADPRRAGHREAAAGRHGCRLEGRRPSRRRRSTPPTRERTSAAILIHRMTDTSGTWRREPPAMRSPRRPIRRRRYADRNGCSGTFSS